jgi:transcriptional regulator of acetoin/glycerol metabolism
VSEPYRIIPLNDVIRDTIFTTIRKLDYNFNVSASMLRIPRTTFYRRISKYRAANQLPPDIQNRVRRYKGQNA